MLDVHDLPLPVPEPINWVALGSAWALTLTFVGLGYSFWSNYVNPDWVVTLGSVRYFAVTLMLSLFTVIMSVFSVQPILYLLIKANMKD